MSEDGSAQGGVSAPGPGHESIISRFERACWEGQRPQIDDFVPADAPGRRALLLELASADLECRLKAGESARVEDYLGRYPELAEDSAAVLSLIRVERAGRGSPITTEEFQRRFARYLGRPTAGPAGAGREPTHPWQAADTVKPNEPTLPRAFDARPALPSVPGYEVLGVLGRGGMGAVYQARHVRLKRVVALKVISAGAQAGPEELGRFRTEAEAAARLQHPNIVQIYEVGTYGPGGAEHPYMALEFVEGGSLAQRPSAAIGELVKIMVQVARAVQHAHERGVIHRDLKPANVLLTKDGTPKITDFGLAKQLEGDAARTASGAVMGTPAYMAPEQAAGRTHDIGPRSDVYSLGAVLYELLAGRPPFVGPSVLGILEQVRSADPLPPSRLRKVPRDLETICLKCLAKEPARRYASARELADDLERFAAGESVWARREGPVGRLWRGVRRRPRAVLAGLGMAIVLAVAAGAVAYFRDSSQVAQQAASLRQKVIDAREKTDDSEQGVAEVDRLIDELARLSPDAAADERRLLAERIEKVIAGRINGRLEGEEVAEVRASIERLAVLSEDGARRLRDALKRRLSDWIEVFRVEGPEFAECEAVFGPEGGAVNDGAVEVRPAAGAPLLDLVLTRRPSPGHAQLRAVFAAADWEAAPSVGVALNASPSRAGYAFVLSAGRGPQGEALTLGAVCRGAGPLWLEILRDGRLMRRQQVNAADLAGRPLTLRAERRGDALACQVNGRAPVLRFRDPFALGAGTGNFGVVARTGARLTKLVADRMSQAADPRPLERGDELFDQPDYVGAEDFYRKQALAAGAGETAWEARYKVGLCLARQRRHEEATRLLKEIALGESPQWAALADLQLWAGALDPTGGVSRTEASASRERLATRGMPVDQLAALLPDDLRTRLLNAGKAPPLRRLLAGPEDAQLEQLRDALAALRLLEENRDRLGLLGTDIVKGFRLVGREEEALRAARDLVSELPNLDTTDNMPKRLLIEQLAWMLRLRPEQGGRQEALALVRRSLEAANDPDATKSRTQVMLLDRARSLAADGKAGDAEKDLDLFLRGCEKQAVQPAQAVEAWLLKGVLHARAQDPVGAAQAWGRGVDAYKRSEARDRTEGVLSVLLDYWMMAALTSRLDDAEAARIRGVVMDQFAADPVAARLVGIFAEQQPLDVYRRMWLTERGRKFVEQITLREVTFADTLRLPLRLNATATLEQLALAGDPTPDQDRLIWDLVGALYAAYVERTLTGVQVASLGSVLLTAQGPVPEARLPNDAALRAPMAYLFGLRYLKKMNAKEAAGFFAEAMKAPADTLAHRLAAEEVKRLK
jgi:hypothetical protein